MAEIPFWVHDRPKWVSGITKSTMCQDVLQALVLAERKVPIPATKSSDSRDNKGGKEAKDHQDLTAKEVSKSLALVEQWRGVERPLSNSSKILKLWLAWGEERSQVRFVVKRISASTSSNAEKSASTSTKSNSSQVGHMGTLGGHKSSRPTRRRNSRASVTSEHKTKKADTVHPNALKHSKNTDLERLMRIILTQGETIHWQLKKLQERECQIESIETEVHNSRTKTAGKDYLLNAYLSQDQINKQTLSQSHQGVQLPGSLTAASGKDIEATAEGIQEILEALSAVFKINEQITEAEEQVTELNNQLTVQPKPSEMKALQSELKDLRTTNDAAGQEIDYNRHLISSMRLGM